MFRTLVTIGFLSTLTASAAAADYGVKGAVATTTSALPSGFAAPGKLVVPTAAGTYPLVITSHGWSASSANQVGWAEHFASYGFVVVVPDFPSPFMPDAAKNRDIIKAIVASIATATTPAKDKVDVSRLGLEGHSAGALATSLAAETLKPAATVLFDPVDRDNLGKAAHATLCAPVLSIFANPSSCNNSAGWFAFRGEVKGPLVSFRVKGSTHCDGENADRGAACGGFCGGAADKGRQAHYARYATAFLLAQLKGDADAITFLAGVKADTALESALVQTTPGCTSPPVDGGVVDAMLDTAAVEDTSAEDTRVAETSVEDTNGEDATTDSAPPAVSDSEAAAGCSCSLPPRRTSASWAALLLVGLLVRRRRN